MKHFFFLFIFLGFLGDFEESKQNSFPNLISEIDSFEKVEVEDFDELFIEYGWTPEVHLPHFEYFPKQQIVQLNQEILLCARGPPFGIA